MEVIQTIVLTKPILYGKIFEEKQMQYKSLRRVRIEYCQKIYRFFKDVLLLRKISYIVFINHHQH